MAVICFAEGNSWKIRRWAMYHFMNTVKGKVEDNPDAVEAIERGLALDGLILHLEDPVVSACLFSAIRETVIEMLKSENISEYFGENERDASFEKDVRDKFLNLLEIIEDIGGQQAGTRGPGTRGM